MANNERYYALDGLRGIAAIVVMIYHFTQHNKLLTWQLGATKIALFSCANLAVDFFIILSGFIIAYSYGSRLFGNLSVSRYLLKRFVRLYPHFFLGLGIGVLTLYFVTKAGDADVSMRGLAASFIYNSTWLPFLHNFGIWNMGAEIPTRGEIFPGNPPAWSLFFEMFASLSFIFLVRLKFKRLLTVCLTALAGFVLAGFLNGFLSYRWSVDLNVGWGLLNFIGGFPRVLFGFSLGIILYRLSIHKHLANELCKISIKSSYPLYLMLILILAFPKGMKGIYPLAILTLVTPTMILAGAKLTHGNKVEIRIAEFLGWISYPIYCLHYPVGRATWLLGEKLHASPITIISCAIFFTLICAIALTKLVEEPARKFLSSALERKDGARIFDRSEHALKEEADRIAIERPDLTLS